MKKISVIIPFYNSEEYIEQCIQSVIHQTYSYWEIVAIDDGSTDNSLKICRELSFTDDRIRLFRQNHKGVSAARNRGIEEAEGEYVLFLDSDDVIHGSLMESFIQSVEIYHAGMVMCQYRKVNLDQMETIVNVEKVTNFNIQENVEVGRKGETEEWFHKKYTWQLSGIGGKMIRRDVIGTQRFDESLRKGEDTLFLYCLISKGLQVVYLNYQWYYYRIHSAGMINGLDSANCNRYFECCRIIRDNEYSRGRIEYALTWERILILQIEDGFVQAKRMKDREKCRCLKKIAFKEGKNLLYRKLDIYNRLLFLSCFFCYPLFLPFRKILMELWNN